MDALTRPVVSFKNLFMFSDETKYDAFFNFVNIAILLAKILMHARIHLFIVIIYFYFSNNEIILTRHLIGIKP